MEPGASSWAEGEPGERVLCYTVQCLKLDGLSPFLDVKNAEPSLDGF